MTDKQTTAETLRTIAYSNRDWKNALWHRIPMCKIAPGVTPVFDEFAQIDPESWQQLTPRVDNDQPIPAREVNPADAAIVLAGRNRGET